MLPFPRTRVVYNATQPLNKPLCSGQQLRGWKSVSFISLADKKPEQRSSFRHRTKGALKVVFQHLQVAEERGWRKLPTYEPADNFPATHQCPGAQATLHELSLPRRAMSPGTGGSPHRGAWHLVCSEAHTPGVVPRQGTKDVLLVSKGS